MRYICIYICVIYIYKYMCMYIYIQSSWRIFWSWRYSCDIQILQHLRASMSAAIVGCVAVTITFLQWPWHCCSDHDIIEVAIVLLQWLLLCCSGFYLVAVPFTLLQWLLHCYCGCCCSGCYFVAVAVTLLQWLLHCCSGCYVVAVAVTLLQWRCCSGCYIIEVAIVLLQWLLHCCSAHSNSSSIPSHIYTTHPSIHTYMCCTTHSRTFTHALSLSLPFRFSGISNEATHQEGQANFRVEATRAFSKKWPPTLVTLEAVKCSGESWLMHMCDLTYVYVWHDVLYVRRDPQHCEAVKCSGESWFLYMCDVAQLHVWRDPCRPRSFLETGFRPICPSFV